MEQYALYLRKSRADLDAEARGEGETLAKHRNALTEFAKNRGLFILKEYSEIVSGDTIAARPQMQQLLEDVNAGMYAGVIVNDVDRLGRGDSIDQEIIKTTFAYANCLIITPNRDINLRNPTDDDMMDFSQFMARFEYKKISQRMTVGRYRAASAGCYISSRPPFGYKHVEISGRHTLEPDPELAPIVRMIFELYASRKYGYYAIATKLTKMGVLTNKNNDFYPPSVKFILKNPVYTGTIVFGKQKGISVIENGKRCKKFVTSESPTICENAHPAIISKELFDRVQQIMNEHKNAAPVRLGYTMTNPLCGIIRCAICGKSMDVHIHSKGRSRYVSCPTHNCPTKSSKLELVESALLEIIHDYSANYTEPDGQQSNYDNERIALEKQINNINSRLKRARELVETSIYSPSEYLEQKKELTAKLEEAQRQLKELEQPKHPQIPAQVVEKTIDAYRLADTAADKNNLLKSIVSYVEYSKTVRGETAFELTIHML